MGLSLDSFDLNGKSYKIQTAHVARAGSAHKKRNFGFIGGGTGLGAALGAIAGGPQGALIGAGAGAAAGTAGAALTGKKNVHIPAETLLNFSLTSPVSVP
jgi:outer membrane lipoprotein SlyB